jgi:hypothetical protein
MVQRVSTVAFEAIEARGFDVRVHVAPGAPQYMLTTPRRVYKYTP